MMMEETTMLDFVGKQSLRPIDNGRKSSLVTDVALYSTL
jgi:hypothetical protein